MRGMQSMDAGLPEEGCKPLMYEEVYARCEGSMLARRLPADRYEGQQ